MDTIVGTHEHASAPRASTAAVTGQAASLPVQGRSRLGAILIKMGLLTQEQVDAALAASERTGRKLGDCLVHGGYITRTDLFQALGHQGTEVKCERLSDLPPFDVLIPLGGDLAAEKNAVVIGDSADERKRCFVVLREGFDRAATLPLMGAAGARGFKAAGTITAASGFLSVLVASGSNGTGQATASREAETELQQTFHSLLHEAFRAGASDIHLLAQRGNGRISFRVNGDLEHVRDITEDHLRELCSTAYNTMVESGSTAGGFRPTDCQSAVIERTFPEGLVRFRYSGLPVEPAGFDVTLRVIPIGVATRQRTFLDLGYSPDQDDQLKRMFSYATGMILFCGVTGSGKSTSLATALQTMAAERPGKKFRSVEEPVEYRIEGVEQTSVARKDAGQGDGKKGGEFLKVLSQILRSDPDVIMVGEIRDYDTAELAIAGARSGHLLASSLHCVDAPTAYDRLHGMGVHRMELSSVGLTVGIVYQSLVPVLCPRCKVAATDIARVGGPGYKDILRRVRAVNEDALENIYFRHVGGCESCKKRGVVGRTVCAEILRPDPDMLAAVAVGDSNRLWSLWRDTIDSSDPANMTGRTAFEHAIWKMRQGMVSPEGVESSFRFLDEAPWKRSRR